MHTVIWWSVWGLVVGISLFGLEEARGHSIHMIISLPLLSGALAAAALRLKHEYHEAMQHARWVLFTIVFLSLGSGYVYLKTGAYGPFATGTSHKAFLQTTFEMSVSEVERALGRPLTEEVPDKANDEGLKDWLFEMIPGPSRPVLERLLPELSIYHVPCQARFVFFRGKLSRVSVEFKKTTHEETDQLVRLAQQDLEREYKPAGSGMVYRKEAVEATIARTPTDPDNEQVIVTLQYLPFASQKPPLLTADTQVF